MSEQLKARLNKIIPRIESKEFLSGSGLGNEIAFYIFDYPPEEELLVRDYIETIMDYFFDKKHDIAVNHINLFRIIVDYLKERGLLDKASKIQNAHGDEELMKALEGPLDERKIAEYFADLANPQKHDVVLVSGVGTAWPFLRAHSLLNNLHHLMENTPLVMFYPGSYDGQSLKLFSRLQDKNYYRAFRLVD